MDTAFHNPRCTTRKPLVLRLQLTFVYMHVKRRQRSSTANQQSISYIVYIWQSSFCLYEYQQTLPNIKVNAKLQKQIYNCRESTLAPQLAT